MALPTRLSGSLLALLLLTGCDDPAQLARDLNDSRAGCNQDSLRVSSETCVRMFEHYAGLATDAIRSYIGGVKAMNEALDRMPPANFDTTGLGHAFSLHRDTTGRDTLPVDGVRASRTPTSPALDYSSGRSAPYASDPAYPGSGPDTYDDSPDAPYPVDGSRSGPDLRGWGGPWTQPPSSSEAPPSNGTWSGSPRYPSPAPRPQTAPSTRPAPAPPVSRPGMLLPPEQRLARPWLQPDSTR